MTVHGIDGPVQVEVDGVVKGLFALDPRENKTYPRKRGNGWCLTHIPTGYAVRYMVCSLARAQKISDLIASGADWNFTDVAEAKLRSPVISAVMARFPKAFVSSFDLSLPTIVKPKQ